MRQFENYLTLKYNININGHVTHNRLHKENMNKIFNMLPETLTLHKFIHKLKN